MIVPVVLIVLRLAMYMWIILAFLNRFFFSFAELYASCLCVIYSLFASALYKRNLYLRLATKPPLHGEIFLGQKKLRACSLSHIV